MQINLFISNSRIGITRILSCLAVASMVLFVMLKMTDLVERKDSIYKYKPFFEHKDEFDVLFMGTSHVINGAYPMELWKDYGITSYNFGGHANEIPTTYWIMENALDYCTPKVMVIDCLNVENNYMTSENMDFVHISFDAFPLSRTKIRAVYDLMDNTWFDEQIEDKQIIKKTKLGLLWNYSIYHNRWDELSEYDFVDDRTAEYGAESVAIIAQPNEKLDIPRPVKFRGYTAGDEYLRRMIEDCQRRGIEVLLTYIPFPASEDREKSSNKVYDLAEEYGVRYINFLDLDIVNYDTDVYDSMSHLNVSGARKVTKYLGEYLKENYDLPDHRESADSHWIDDYYRYEAAKLGLMDSSKELNNLLLVLADEHIAFTMTIEDPAILANEETLKLLDNIGIDRDVITSETKLIINADNRYAVLNGDITDRAPIITESGPGILYIENGVSAVYVGDELFIERTEEELKSTDRSATVHIFKNENPSEILRTYVFQIPDGNTFHYGEEGDLLVSRAVKVSGE